MTQTPYIKWQSSVLAGAGNYILKECNDFRAALLGKISKHAKAVDTAVVAKNRGCYLTSCFIKHSGKFVRVSHFSDAWMDDGAEIEPNSFLIQTARHVRGHAGGANQYCDMSQLRSMIDRLLS